MAGCRTKLDEAPRAFDSLRLAKCSTWNNGRTSASSVESAKTSALPGRCILIGFIAPGLIRTARRFSLGVSYYTVETKSIIGRWRTQGAAQNLRDLLNRQFGVPTRYRVEFGLGAVPQYSNTPSLRAAGFEDEDDDEDENEAPSEHPQPATRVQFGLRAILPHSNTPSLRGGRIRGRGRRGGRERSAW
jgi:hypothetical protein